MPGIDTRLTLPPTVSPQGRTPAERVQAAREAQRAFFNAALAGETPPLPAAPSTAPLQAAQPPATAPDRPLRPGSIVDIKV